MALDLQMRPGNAFFRLKSKMDQQQQQQQGHDAQLVNEHPDQHNLTVDKQSIVDDDLDFDPIKETQKGLAEMMATEMLQQNEPKTR